MSVNNTMNVPTEIDISKLCKLPNVLFNLIMIDYEALENIRNHKDKFQAKLIRMITPSFNPD